MIHSMCEIQGLSFSILTPILYKENDNESEVSKSSIESNADKKPEKLATRKPLRKLRKPKS